MPKLLDLTGHKYGMLSVIRKMVPNYHGRTAWMCECECGEFAIVTAKNMRNGSTKSCGCLHIAHAKTLSKINEKPIGYKRVNKQNGRVEIKTERGFVYEHVYLMELKLGRRLKKGEVSHHIDHNKQNNTIQNLLLMTHGDHTKLHHTGRVRTDSTKAAISKANSKYTQEKADQIRSMVRNGMSQRKAAFALKMSPMTVSRIIRNVTYKEK